MVVIFVDIDGTICETRDGDYKNSKPHVGRIEQINRLYDKGHEIVYYTARGTTTRLDWKIITMNQLHQWKAKHHNLIMGKNNYDLMICDKAVNADEFFRLRELGI